MPEDKVKAIKNLQVARKITRVGDGVNDALTMASDSGGIAMAIASSDVALETADVALIADYLSHLPFVVGLTRRTSSTVKQNLFFSFGVVALLVPATILGLGIGPIVVAHEGSMLIVVFNALWLMAYKER